MSDTENNNSPAAAQAAISGSAEPAQVNTANEIEELRKSVVELQTLLQRQQERLEAVPPAYSTEELRKREVVRDRKPVLTREQAIHTVGPLAWRKMTPEQRVSAQMITTQDLNNEKPETYFGRHSNSRKANALAISNPALYKLLKAKAIEEGII